MNATEQIKELARQAQAMKHALPNRRRKENDEQYAFRAQLALQRAFEGLNEQYDALLLRYPNPGPATMQKLEDLHARIMAASVETK
jgi:hypothetical protein